MNNIRKTTFWLKSHLFTSNDCPAPCERAVNHQGVRANLTCKITNTGSPGLLGDWLKNQYSITFALDFLEPFCVCCFLSIDIVSQYLVLLETKLFLGATASSFFLVRINLERSLGRDSGRSNSHGPIEIDHLVMACPAHWWYHNRIMRIWTYLQHDARHSVFSSSINNKKTLTRSHAYYFSSRNILMPTIPRRSNSRNNIAYCPRILRWSISPRSTRAQSERRKQALVIYVIVALLVDTSLNISGIRILQYKHDVLLLLLSS